MKRLIIMLIAGLMTCTATATQQIQDQLTYEGQVYAFGGNGNFPLEEYFESCSEEATHQWIMLRIACNTDGKRISLCSTGCWRGHVAHWAVETNLLVLTAIEIKPKGTKFESVEILRPIFGDQIKDGKLAAHWFSGHITIGGHLEGKREILFFEKGHLVRTEKFESGNELFREDQRLLAEERERKERQLSKENTDP